MRILGIIPARYTSSRFPGKALVNIEGKSMVQRVYEQAKKARTLDQVAVATDDSRIYQHVKDFGGEVHMTDASHMSGTERCCEVLEKQSQSFDFAINIQGDEPFIKPQQIEDLTASLGEQIQIATLAKRIDDSRSLDNPHEVKVIFNHQGHANYFSRSPLPYCKDLPKDKWLEKQSYYRHIGIYGYRQDILRTITRLPVTPWELSEGLEQLRWLYHGIQIAVFTTEYQSVGIDTPEDLERVLRSNLS